MLFFFKMYIVLKNVFVTLGFICLLSYVFLKNITVGYFDRLLIAYCLYYCAMLTPKVHQIYIYNLVERIIPKWTYIIRILFHYTCYYPNLTKAFPATLCVVMIMLWKDILFLIRHAEKRLAKIEMSMYDEESPHRIAHLHLNVFKDDINNRFHKHCFDTNRIYLIDNTPSSRDSLLSIYNYRALRLEGKKPRPFTGDDELHYTASNNKRIFISQRLSFVVTPLILLGWLMCMTDLSTSSHIFYIHHGILLLDVITQQFGNKVNDVVIDISYFIGMLVIVSMYPLYN